MAKPFPSRNTRLARTLGALLLAGLLAGCQGDEFSLGSGPKHLRPVSAEVKHKMTDLGMDVSSPIMIRIFKEESQLEVWKQAKNGRYALLQTFEICKWSGELGPKIKEGDRQAPEGFYEITPALMNPNSSYHLAFNLGYPNAFDRSHGRTGSHLMVHGACSSRGCYAMTDEQVQDIYALARDSFKGGQRSFQVQAFPFRMTPENMARHRHNQHIDFWRMLKAGYDHFEVTKLPPKVDVCERKYVYDATSIVEGVPFKATAKCPEYKVPEAVEVAVVAKQRQDEAKFQQVVASLEAKAEREKRWQETQTRIAALVGGSDAAATGAPAPEMPAAPAGAIAVATNGEPLPQANPARAAAPAAPASGGIFASLFNNGAQPDAAPTEATGTVAAPDQMPATAQAAVSATAFAAGPAPAAPEKRGLLRRWLPFGQDSGNVEAATAADLGAVAAVPPPKP
ncbi:L,D-transpeptidase family protein [Polymorphum gilvum]|uniref:Putative transcriptional regulatory protein n=1 Tax=Polymorphum gilvum (strain LMG 25793 / CGMCC 1.9160 / SL003B-26A1) TaxID=991905 RepID=F2J211_POLGS|nr:murein L,D-transpeptidase family protein [Polymorphum gilvum]ADZ68770.1 Putative transcriptional regulatory protein [Polymorphum gilvum SL003B-26A1]